jgi:hypothetical protein
MTNSTPLLVSPDLAWIGQSPPDLGRLELIVARPAIGERLVLDEAELRPGQGLVGDNWHSRGSVRMPNGQAHPDMELTLMNARVAATVAGERDRWPLAGDQLFVDLDLSEANLQPGDRLQIGPVVLEITPMPHNGCAKFSQRFGVEALSWISRKENRSLRLRGIYARVIEGGQIIAGSEVRKVSGGLD